jgi:Domain of unknown function (DUF222)
MTTIIDTPPPSGPAGPGACGDSAAATPGGLSWMWELDLDAVLAALTGTPPWLRARRPGTQPPDPDDRSPAQQEERDPEADEAEYQEALEAGRVRTTMLGYVAGRVAETLPTGPGLAAWLAHAEANQLEDGALAGIAAAYHRIAAWAAAGELAAVAQIASRSAETDRRASADQTGRPDRVTADAAAQVSLALAISRDTATSWTDFAITLTWRLPVTLSALAAGQIDLTRARMIARMTKSLSDEQARQVEAAVLGHAGSLTPGQLHAALGRAVIKVDPDGAERRREQSERDAAVTIYPDDEGTVTLAGRSLPAVEAAAAMARITALAKAMKADGASHQMNWLRAQAFLGLLLGTLTPPAEPGGPDGPSNPEEPSDPGAPSEGGKPSPGEPSPGEPFPPSGPSGGQSPADGHPSWPGIQPDLPWNTAAGAAPAGLLNLTVPLSTLTGTSATSGQLTWLGIITASQARHLAELAARHGATQWRVVIVNHSGRAIAVTHIPRSRSPGSRDRPGIRDRPGKTSTGLIRRVTLVTGTQQLANPPPTRDPQTRVRDPELARILDQALIVAQRAAQEAKERATEDQRTGGCAHQLATPTYRPPPRIAELVTARDQTCRFPPCRRPAEMCDLDHAQPYHQGGPTCACNIGAECRTDHQLKQDPRWTLTQTPGGEFRWTTPAGRTYISRPDPYFL